MIKYIFLLICLFSSISISAQEDTVKLKYDGYEFIAGYDTANYCSILRITKKGVLINQDSCTDRITSIEAYDLKGEDKKQILIDYYTGGAHCCTYTHFGEIRNNNLIIFDTIFWGNAGYEVKDLDGDGTKEIFGSSDVFAYGFTNYAESRFPVVIYKFEKGKLKFVNSEFPEIVEKDIKEIKKDLLDFIKNGYECPKSDTEDTFNTDAGTLKTLLAPIVADYQSLGRIQEGYEYIDKMYKCPDKAKFVKILKTDYKLK